MGDGRGLVRLPERDVATGMCSGRNNTGNIIIINIKALSGKYTCCVTTIILYVF